MIAQLDSLYIKLRPTKAVSRLLSYALFEGRPLTTRGRWINPLVFALYGLYKRLPQPKTVNKPIFVLGTGRSGTTVMGMLLSMHKDVAFLNEPKALWHAIYPEEDLIGSYSRGKAYYRLAEHDATEEVSTNAHRLFGTYLAATLSKRVVDKYPELIFRLPFVKAIFPDARFLFLVRNGWDTCHSIQRWSERLGEEVNGERHDWWGTDNRKWHLLVEQLVVDDPVLAVHQDGIRSLGRHTDMAAIEWVLTMREGLSLLECYPNAIKMVRYEELVRAPREVLSDIAQFCELTSDDTFFEYGEKKLRSAPPSQPFDLHPAIRPLFEETMQQLGYTG